MNINKEMITDISGVNPRKCMKCGNVLQPVRHLMQWIIIHISLLIW